MEIGLPTVGGVTSGCTDGWDLVMTTGEYLSWILM
jgi:hypothetical protein